MARTACLVCLVLLVAAAKKGKCLWKCGASSSTQQNLSNLYSLDICGECPLWEFIYFEFFLLSYKIFLFLVFLPSFQGHLFPHLSTWGRYYKTLPICNLRQMGKFHIRLAYSGLDKHTSLNNQTRQLTMESVHYECVPGLNVMKLFTAVIYQCT